MAESSRSSGLGGGSRPLWDPVAPADEEEEHPRQIAGGSEARSLWTMEVAEERGIPPPPPPPVWRPSFPPPVAAYSAPAGRRRPSIRAPAPISPRSSPGYAPAFFCEIGRDEEGRHFLDNCTLCRKPLRNRDIYMYKGDVPFCSEECRQEQIDKDEARERTGSMKTSPRKSSSSSSPEQQQKGIRVPAAGAIVAG